MEQLQDLIFHRMNTLERLTLAQGRCVSMVEIDVCLIDGKLAVVHPKDLHRTPETTEQISWAGLQTISPLRVPTFEEYLEQSALGNTRIFIEAKGSSAEITRHVCHGILQEISAARRRGVFPSAHYPQTHLILHGFSIEAMRDARQYMHDAKEIIRIGLGWTSTPTHAAATSSTSSALEHVKKEMDTTLDAVRQLSEHEWQAEGMRLCKKNGFEIIVLRKDAITASLIAYAHELGLDVFACVSNDEAETNYLRSIQVDKIIFEPLML